MLSKKSISLMALTALVSAATLPVDGQASLPNASTQTYLAKGKCGSSCGGGSLDDSDSDTTTDQTSTKKMKSSDANKTNANSSNNTKSTKNAQSDVSYRYKNNNSDRYLTDADDNSSNSDNSKGSNSGNSSKSDVSYRSRNTNSEYLTEAYNNYNNNLGSSTSPTYVETTPNMPQTPPNFGANTSMNRNYNTASSYDYNRPAASTTAVGGRISEAQLWSALNPQAREIYLKMDPEWRAKAVDLASQDSYRDKNLAIKEAQRRMNEQREAMNSR